MKRVDFFGKKPVEAFAEADRAIGKGRALTDKLRALGQFVGKDVRVRIRFRGYSALHDKERTVNRTVRMTPKSGAEIRAKYFEIIRNTLNKWRGEFEDSPAEFGWYSDVSVTSSGFSVEPVQPATPKKRKKSQPKKKGGKRGTKGKGKSKAKAQGPGAGFAAFTAARFARLLPKPSA